MPKFTSSSLENIEKAVDAVKNGMSKKAAAKLFKVARTTIIARLSGKLKKIRPGPETVLTSAEEKLIVDWIIESQRKGFPKRKEDLQYAVHDFLNENPRANLFINNMPGEGWYKAFLKRHPILAIRTPEAVTAASSNVGKDDIIKWFCNIEEYLKREDYFEILSDPTRIFNGDETNFQLCPKTKAVLAPKGSRNVYEVDQGLAKQSITVMFTFSAAGVVTNPMIIYPYKRLPNEIQNSVPKDWGIGTSDNGWMIKEVFYEYVGHILYPHLKKLGVKFPIIYFVDGHSTHLTLQLSNLCKKLGIILIALYPNATRILQPADVSAFKPLKNAWKNAVLEFRRNNPNISLNKEKFAPLLKTALDKGITQPTVVNGFRACGIFPWNYNAIDYSKCIGKSSVVTQVFPPLSYEKFTEIIGQNRIEKFSKSMCTMKMNIHEVLIYKIYCHFNQQIDTNLTTASIDDDNFENFDDGINKKIDEELRLSTNGNLISKSQSEFQLSALPKPLDSITSTSFVNNELKDLHLSNFEDDVNQKIDEKFRISRNENLIPTIQTELQSSSFPKSLNSSTDIQILNTNETNENFDIMNMEVVMVGENDLKEYLTWPKTPTRKGVKNSTKRPYVLTSSEYISIEEAKQTEKIQKINDIEKRKMERALKKEARDIETSKKLLRNRKKGKTIKSVTTKKAVSQKNINKTLACKRKSDIPHTVTSGMMQKFIPIEESNDTNIHVTIFDKLPNTPNTPNTPLTIKTNMNIYTNEKNSTISSNRITITSSSNTPLTVQNKMNIYSSDKKSTTRKNSPKKMNIISNKSYLPKLKNSHIRQLFSEANKTLHESKIEASDNDYKNFFGNKPVIGKMCYECTYSISRINPGVQCQKCIKTLHLKCINKLQLKYDPLFYCSECIRKK